MPTEPRCDCPDSKTQPAGARVPPGTIAVLMPQAGNTMEEGTIVTWRVHVGDRVKVGQILCDIETDKATVEVEATDAGTVARIVAAAGAVVPVKQPIAYLAGGDAVLGSWVAQESNTPAAAPAATVDTTVVAMTMAAPAVTQPATATKVDSKRPRVSPLARKIAAEKGIDLASVKPGSGPGGRIVSTDLTGLIGTTAAATRVIGRRPMSKMRKAVALNLQTAKQTVPHFYVRATINADSLMAFYKAQKPATGCTLNDVLLLAVGRVVGEMAAFRSRVDGGDIVEMPTADIGVAVSIPPPGEGLVVPAVLGVHTLTLGQVAAAARRVVDAARGGRIENLGKAVFTISNMGMLGVEEFAAIINPPESGILAISAVREAVIVKDGAMRAGRVMSLTLSVDHRVVDGAMAAQFMGRLRELLEAPERLG
jgi:pyruvate dehydrogenase E2 component (dihydrolipoamide acetyltransferase)